MATAKAPPVEPTEPLTDPVEPKVELDFDDDNVARETKPAPAPRRPRSSPCPHGCGTVHPVPVGATSFACEHGSWDLDGSEE